MKEDIKLIISKYHLCKSEMSERIYESTINSLISDILVAIKERESKLMEKLQVECENLVLESKLENNESNKYLMNKIRNFLIDRISYE